MGKLIMPKNEGRIKIIMDALKIYYDRYYYDRDDYWVNNKYLIEELGKVIGSGKENSWYTKKTQVATYFGLLEWKPGNGSERRITESGIKFYEAYEKYKISNNDEYRNEYEKILMESIKDTTFGRNNYGSEESKSDVEPPNVFIRGILDLGNISKNEFGYMLYLLHNKKESYEEVLKAIRDIRRQDINIPNLKDIKNGDKCYFDPKPIATLIQLGLFQKIDTTKTKNRSKADRSSRFVIKEDFKTKYIDELSNLSIYNQETKNILSNVDIYSIEENIDDIEDILNEKTYGLPILTGTEKDRQNNRKPKRSSHKKGKRYDTNPSIKKTAIDECGYKCFYNENHTLFKNKYGTDYVEGHHIVPMKAQDDFKDINLDRTENIVALCPYCHKAIHHGNKNTVTDILSKIFKDRENELKAVGIKINIDDLYNKYYK